MNYFKFGDVKIGNKFIINLNKNIIVTVTSTTFKDGMYGDEPFEYPIQHTLSWFNTLNELQQIYMNSKNTILFTKVE